MPQLGTCIVDPRPACEVVTVKGPINNRPCPNMPHPTTWQGYDLTSLNACLHKTCQYFRNCAVCLAILVIIQAQQDLLDSRHFFTWKALLMCPLVNICCLPFYISHVCHTYCFFSHSVSTKPIGPWCRFKKSIKCHVTWRFIDNILSTHLLDSCG